MAPKYCLQCFKYNKKYLCKECLKTLNFEISFNCLECERRIVSRCPIKSHNFPIKFLISFAKYENLALNNLIILGKSGVAEIFSDLGYIIGQILKNYNFQDFYLTPIPLHPKKLLERGFNQAEVLAKKISQITNMKIFNGLIKIKETKDQVGLSFEERLINLKGAFALKEKPPSKIILVDDVKTTGATLKEAALVLKKQKVKEIIALTILR